MTRFRYAPEGVKPREWDMDLMKLLSPECMAIEKATGMDYYSEFMPRLGNGNMTAISALLWIFLKREHPTLRFDEVQFCLDEIDFIEDDSEPDGESEQAAQADGGSGKG